MEYSKLLGFTQQQAIEYLERIRWDGKQICPHCGHEKFMILKGKTTRAGLYKCTWCRKQYTVTVGTLFEGSHIPLNKWIAAFSLVCSSKKGISAHQIHRLLGITYKSAWFMVHRIRYAIKSPAQPSLLDGKVEVDETFIGGKEGNKKLSKRGQGDKKTPVVALVQRDGDVRTHIVRRVSAKELKKVIDDNVNKNATLITDDFKSYVKVGKEFAGGHKVVCHSREEYVKGDIYTNTVESYFALLKRGVTGTFHHVSEQHLHRYCEEFNFRWNTRKLKDYERTNEALKTTVGKKLAYTNRIKAIMK